MAKATDDFLVTYRAEPDPVKRMLLLTEFVNIFYDSDMESINQVLDQELKTFRAIGSIDGEALVLWMLAYGALGRGDFKTGEEHVSQVMRVFDRVQSPEVRAQIYNFLAFTQAYQGNFDAAFGYVYDCIREAQKIPESRNSFWGTYTLAVLYFDLKDMGNAEKYYREAAENFRKYENEYGVARSENGLASVYILQEKYEEASELLKRCLFFYDKVGAASGQSRSLNDLGLIARKNDELGQALGYLKRSLEIRKKTSHVQGVATSLIEIAEVLILQKEYAEALACLEEARALCEQVGNRSKLYRTHLLFSKIYRDINEPWKALEHYEQYDRLKSEVTGEAANNKIKELQTRMATEKSEKEAEIERLKNVELKNANLLISEKNKEILDSIRYAKRIQLSLMPTEKYIDRVLQRALGKKTFA
jgi:tetratricopeptide (TPR) repeat protein